MAPRLTSSSNGRGPVSSAVIAEWAGRNPKIRRVWVSDSRVGNAPRPGEGVPIAVELQPVPDSEERLDPDEGATMSPPGLGEADSLIYERAG